MAENDLTCALVDERDLDTRYLAGRLSPEEAEPFEAHFFSCNRCWALVHQGSEVQSALADPAVPRSAGSRSRWWGLAAAASIAAIAVGLWRLGDVSDSGRSEDVLRGNASSLVVTSAADRDRLKAAWPRRADAEAYRVRLYSADGLMLLERETPDSFVAVPVDSLAPPAAAGPLFWQVQALDRLRNPVARSELIPAVLPNP